MSASSRTDWFWSDWLGDPAVRRLTPAERGVWIDLLALAAAAKPVGYVCDEKGKSLTYQEIARVTNAASPVEVAKLIDGILEKGAASRDRAGRLYNRRMVRMATVAAKRRLNGRLGGAATRLKWQAFSGLPQQNAWHLPQQPTAPPFPLSKKNNSSFPTAAQEQETDQQSARSLATALPAGALARSPHVTVSPELSEILKAKGWKEPQESKQGATEKQCN